MYPAQERGDPGVDPRVSRLGTAPANDSYLTVRAVLTQHSQRAPTVPLTGIPAIGPRTYHVVRYPVIPVTPGTLTVRHRVEPHLLQCVSQGPGGVQSPPASHHGGHVVVVLAGLGKAYWLEN